MSIAITSVTQKADKSWVFTWDDAGAAYYRVVLWGVQLEQTAATDYTWHGQEYKEFPPPVEIAYEGQKVLSEQFLPYLVVQWYREDGVRSYEVQKKVGTSWVKVKAVEESGEWVYTYRSVILEDRHLYEYRVVTVDVYGNQSEPQEYRRFVVTPPVPVDDRVKVNYSDGNVMVVEA